MRVDRRHFEMENGLLALAHVDLLDRELCQLIEPAILHLLLGEKADFDHLGEVRGAFGTVFVDEADPLAFILAVANELRGGGLILALVERAHHRKKRRRVLGNEDVGGIDRGLEIGRNSVH